MNPNLQGMPPQAQLTLASQAVSPDGSSLVQTYTINLTQAQLTMQLAQLQQRVSQMNQQIAQANAQIAQIQAQLALFVPVQPTPVQPAPDQPAG